MKAYGEADLYINIFLTSALVGGEWSASRPSSLTTRERAHGTHWIGGWVDPRAGLDDVEKRNSDPSIVQPVASRYTKYTIPAPKKVEAMGNYGTWV
jgi:hypothetical protein